MLPASSPLLSVVVPTRHRNKLLRECLDCLTPGVQTLPSEIYEVLITDDGSESTAESMVKKDYPWSRWTAGPKRGPAANRNAAVAQARGEWICFVDDDCLPVPGWLAAFYTSLKEDVFVYEGKTDCNEPIEKLTEESPLNRTGGSLWSCNMMVAKRLFIQLGGFDETFPTSANEDADFRERLLAAGYQFPFVEAALVYHPPRPRRFGAAAGRLVESNVLMWYKSGRKTPIGKRLPTFLLRQRLHDIKVAPLSRHVPRAIASMIAEVYYVARHLKEWEQKYSARYENAAPAYPEYNQF